MSVMHKKSLVILLRPFYFLAPISNVHPILHDRVMKIPKKQPVVLYTSIVI